MWQLPYHVHGHTYPVYTSPISSATLEVPLALPIEAKPLSLQSLSHLNKHILDLRAVANVLLCQPKKAAKPLSVASLLKRSYELDAALTSWRGDFISSLHFAPVKFKAPAGWKLDLEYADVYSDLWAAKLWNTFRTSRIFIQIVILNSIVWFELGQPDQKVKADRLDRKMSARSDCLLAKDLLQSMVDEIVSSVPFHLGYVTGVNSKTPRPKCLNFTPSPSQLRNLGTVFILWPLYVTRTVPIISDARGAEIKALIADIAKEVGLNPHLVSATLREDYQLSHGRGCQTQLQNRNPQSGYHRDSVANNIPCLDNSATTLSGRRSNHLNKLRGLHLFNQIYDRVGHPY